MQTIAVQAPAKEVAECPNCRNREGIRDGSLSARHRKLAYDIWTDSHGLLRCPRCAHRAPWADFHRPQGSGVESFSAQPYGSQPQPSK